MMSSVVAPGCVFTYTWSFLEIPGPVMCFTMESPIIKICLRDLLFLFPFSWGSLIFVFGDAVVSDVSMFLLKFKSLFPFSWGTDFVKSVLFCVDRMRFVLIDSTNVVLFFKRF